METPVSDDRSGHPSALAQVVAPDWLRTLGRCAKYLSIRALVIGLTVCAGVYAAIWVTNLGGFGDELRKSEIRHGVVMGALGAGLHVQEMSNEERAEYMEGLFQAAYRGADLDQPFILRSFRYFRDAMTLSLGRAPYSRTGRGSDRVVDILMQGIPWTLLLFGIANAITFILSLYLALLLSRKYGSLVDRAATLLVPALTAPPWFHGLFLIVVFALLAGLLPFGGIGSSPIPETLVGRLLSLLKHLILPVGALVLGTLPYAMYANRALFLIHSTEDYVEMAKAKGLKPSRMRTRYILRPVLPAIITNFALISLVSWQAVILTEHIFNWPGLGELLITSIRANEVAIFTGAITVFAYMIGLTVFFLDIAYVIADPRVSLGSTGRA